MKEKNLRCKDCCMKERYERNPRSLMARLWRWHTSFCPGWKAYMRSLPEHERAEIVERFNLKRKTY